MKKYSTTFLKAVIVLMGVVTAICLIWFPQTEGRAANLDLLHIYADPLIIYSFLASIPFFIALRQAFKLLGYIEQNKIFSPTAVRVLGNIKYCALSIIALIAAAVLYIRFMVHGDDPAGPSMMGFLTMFASGVIATAAAVFQKLLQNAVDLKSENDLTV